MTTCQIFTESQIESLRVGGKVLRGCLDHVATLVQPGVTTAQLDAAAEEYITSHEGAKPGFKGYNGFPATLCTSVNEQCVHGIPNNTELKEGDIVSVDCGVIYNNLYTDACVTVGAGQISQQAQDCMDASEKALQAAIGIITQGVKVGDISSTIQQEVERRGFVCMPALTGHGLGNTLHQFPDVPNVGEAGTGAELPAYTMIAVEPIVSAGSSRVVEADDGWTLSVSDGALSTHFEHSILILPEGNEIIA